MTTDRSRRIRSTHAGRRLSQRARAWAETTETLCLLMEHLGVTRAELARRLDVSPARITQLLDGTRNLTLATLSDLLYELGFSLHVRHGPLTEALSVQEAPGTGGEPARSPRQAGKPGRRGVRTTG